MLLFSNSQPWVYSWNNLKISQISASIFLENISLQKRKSVDSGLLTILPNNTTLKYPSETHAYFFFILYKKKKRNTCVAKKARETETRKAKCTNTTNRRSRLGRQGLQIELVHSFALLTKCLTWVLRYSHASWLREPAKEHTHVQYL